MVERLQSKTWFWPLKNMLAIGVVIPLLIGCVGIGDYRAAQLGVVAVDPRDIAVDPLNYPIYQVVTEFTPPRSYKIPSKEEYFAEMEEMHREWLGKRYKKEKWIGKYGKWYADTLVRSARSPIYPSDEWHVTHVYQGLYLIFSEEYQERECERLSKLEFSGAHKSSRGCRYRDKIHIFISPEGRVSGGFSEFDTDSFFASDRRAPIFPDHTQDKEWNEMVTFTTSKPQREDHQAKGEFAESDSP